MTDPYDSETLKGNPAIPDEPALTGRLRAVVDQIFLGAAAMVGVSVTLLGIVAIISTLEADAALIDEILAADAIAFLASTLAAYLALRSTSAVRARRYARIADGTFVVGMVTIVVAGALIAQLLIR